MNSTLGFDASPWARSVTAPPPRRRLAAPASLEALEAFEAFEAFELLEDGELDQFLGRLARGVARGVKQASRSVGQAASVVSKMVPLSQLASAAARANPLSTVVRAAWGGLAAGLEGKNVLTGAARAALPDALGRFVFDAGRSVLRGDNLVAAVRQAANAGIGDAREQLRFVQMVAPFVPGVGTGVAAALGAANALAEGRPITQAFVAAARGALPGGVAAQAAFDTAWNLSQGKTLAAAMLQSARNALPGGALARAAFDTAVAIGQGKRLQEAGLAAVRGALPGGPAAQAGFDIAMRVARGKSPSAAVLDAARARLPGAAARAAFDATIAVAQGRPLARVAGSLPGAALGQIQGVAAAAATRVLRSSPYAADARSFARAAARGGNIQAAALSSAGRQVLARMRR